MHAHAFPCFKHMDYYKFLVNNTKAWLRSKNPENKNSTNFVEDNISIFVAAFVLSKALAKDYNKILADLLQNAEEIK